MVAGQSIDLLSEHHELNEATLQYIHTHKTADLLTAPLLAAAYIAGADEKAISALETFGLCVGLAFQIDDDLLDVLGDAKDLGKQTGMDAQRGKMTWPSLVGVEAAQKKSRELWTRAEEALFRRFGVVPARVCRGAGQRERSKKQGSNRGGYFTGDYQ